MRKTRLLSAVLCACLLVVLAALWMPMEAKAETEGSYTYTVTDGKATITQCNTAVSGHIAVPNRLGGYPVTTIGKNAFAGCNKLVRVTVSEGITTIEEGAFNECLLLDEVTLPNGVTTIGANAFANCPKLGKVVVPNTVLFVDGTAFENSESLAYNEFGNAKYLGNDEERYIILVEALSKDITTCQIHENAKLIYDKAFYECSGLTNIVIPDGVKTIGDNAFFRCTSLRKLTIGNGVTTIGEKAFSWCQGLTEVTVAESVTTISPEAFSACVKMTDILLPSGLTAIGEGVFNSCVKLQNIYFKGTEGQWALIGGNELVHNATVFYEASNCIHKWDEGTVTQEPNCVASGVKTYTCGSCQIKRTEELPMLTTHTYLNDCDTDCEFCPVVREITHNYQDTWSADEMGHWYECAVCGEKKEAPVAHTPSAEPTETDPQICTECGYIIQPALGHTHNFGVDWKTDRDGHWHGCDGCEEKGEYQAHDFENDCDVDCSVCGYTRTTQHSYKTEWSADAQGHWHECTGCGDKKNESAHTPGPEATETESQTCTDCGYELAPAIGTPTEPAPDGEDGRGILVTVIVIVAVLAAAALGITEVFLLRNKRR